MSENTLKTVYNRLCELLAEVPDSSFDALCIFEQFVARREEMIAYPERECSEDSFQRAVNAAHKRTEGYPLQYILGEWEFYGMTFRVGEGVLIPRPDTELAVDEALRIIDSSDKKGRLICADLCSGSGCIAAAVAKQRLDRVRMFAVENSGDAFPYLAENISRHGVNVTMIRGDVSNGHLLDNFVDDDGEEIGIDIIISNPPYLTDEEMDELQREVSFEPQTALYGGSDGLKFYRVISALWGSILNHGGYIIFEIGSGQTADVRSILEETGFTDITVLQYAGLDRVMTARKK